MAVKQKEIVMSFDIFGNSKVDAVGFVGNSCEAATKVYVTALNSREKTVKRKPEYSMPNASAAKAEQSW